MYTPTQDDIMFAKAINDKLVATQTYNPSEIKEAYRRLFGEEAPNQHFARSKVFTYFQYIYKAVDKTETAVPNSQTLSTETSTSTHNEEDMIAEMEEIESNVRIITFNNEDETVTVDGVTHDLKNKKEGADLSEIIKPKRKRNTKKTNE